MAHAEMLLGFARQLDPPDEGLLVAGFQDRTAVEELERNGLVRVERERDDSSGFRARIFYVPEDER